MRNVMAGVTLLLATMLVAGGVKGPTATKMGAASGENALEAKELEAKNVVVIVSDDHTASVTGAYGNEIVRTPNLDRLAAQGVQFNRAYANAPVCTPSRQSLLTGMLPHAIGVTRLQTPLPEEKITLADHLKDLGYRTAAIGKMHFQNKLKHGFERRVDRSDYRAYLREHPPRRPPDSIEVRPTWRPFRDPARIWLNAEGLPSKYYYEDTEAAFLTREAINFMRENRDDRFLLWLGYHEPHSPFRFPVEYRGKYDPQEMPLPPTSAEDEQWMPDIFEDLREEEMRGIVRSYYTSLEFMDDNIGRVLDAIDQMGLDDNTLVIYLSDHGYLLGHHGRFEKHMMWEPAVRVPLLMRAPEGEHREKEALVELVDVVPTILDILRKPYMEKLQGESLLPLLETGKDKHRQYVFSEFLEDNKAMVRTDKWKYIFTSGKKDLGQGYATGNPPPGIRHRLYNQKQDPQELHNVAGDEHYKGIMKSLQIKMLERFLNTYPEAEEIPSQLSLEEALVWFTEPPGNRNERIDLN